MASALICAWISLEPSDREAFLDFHDREHIPERLDVAGFRHGRRFESTIDPNRFLLVYEVDAISVLVSPAYLERQNAPTEWTRRSIPLIREPRRLALSLDLSLGQARGGAVALIHFDRLSGEQVADIRTQAVELMRRRGVLAVHLGRVDLAASNIVTVEREALGSPDNREGVVLLVEATEPAVAGAAIDAIALQADVRPLGQTETWRLQSSLGA